MERSAGVVLVAAGAGRRLGAPKALLELRGRTLVARAAEAFAGLRDRVLVLRPEDLDRVDLEGWRKVAGGARRRDSVERGLRALDASTSLVLVHDAARPLVGRELVGRVLAAAARARAVVPAVPVVDTVKRVENGRVVATLDRASLVLVQTPQAFETALLRRALEATSEDATDDAALVEALGEPVLAVEGDPRNIKITTTADLAVAEALLGS
jgi:2-C-methyl-D-erythritol 4-phosphate cytidylyltransferase